MTHKEFMRFHLRQYGSGELENLPEEWVEPVFSALSEAYLNGIDFKEERKEQANETI